MQEIIYVDNLKCHGCANTITNKLKALAGVDQVKVEVEESKIEVKHQQNVTREDFLKTLAGLGYPELGTSNTIQKAKSYVSCAVGRLGS